MNFSTIAIHSHQEPDPQTGSVIPPLYQTSTFAFDDIGAHKGYIYTRFSNPTQSALEGVLAELEGGSRAMAFSSGMGAISSLFFAVLKPGDHILVEENVYGGTYQVLTKVIEEFQISVSFIDVANPDTVRAALRPETRMIYLESPTNPTLKVIDLDTIGALAKEHGLISVVDNTFATPYLQNPLKHGIDVVVHSTTKYINGHSDVIGGALVVKDAALAEKLAFHQLTIGATPDPFACWLTLRGIKTLGVRMEAHCRNALALAQFLQTHPLVESVAYPGLTSHPQHTIALRQMKRGAGGIIGLRLKGGAEECRTFLLALKLFGLAVSLGGVESLACHPVTMTHRTVAPDLLARTGLTNDFIRLSVGIEDLEDLKADLAQALDVVQGKHPAACSV